MTCFLHAEGPSYFVLRREVSECIVNCDRSYMTIEIWVRGPEPRQLHDPGEAFISFYLKPAAGCNNLTSYVRLISARTLQ